MTVLVFLFRNVRQYFTSFLVGDVFAQHMVAYLTQFGVNVFQRVGRALHIGAVKVQQQVNAVSDVAGLGQGAALLQPKNRQLFIAQRKQHAAMQDKGHGHAAGALRFVVQKIGVQVDVVVFFHVKPRGDLQLGCFNGVCQLDAKVRPNECPFRWGGVDQVHPYRLGAFQHLTVGDVNLPDLALHQFVEIDFAPRKMGLAVSCNSLAARFAHFPQHLVLSCRWYADPQFLGIQLSQSV